MTNPARGISYSVPSTDNPWYKIARVDVLFLGNSATPFDPSGLEPAPPPGAAITDLTIPAGTPDDTIADQAALTATAMGAITAPTIALATSDAYTDAAVNAAVNAALATLSAAVKTQVDAALATLKTKLDTANNTADKNALNLAKKINDGLSRMRGYGVIAP